MFKLRNVKLVAALTAAVIGLSLSGAANATMQEKMNKLFGDMSNTTSPGQFNTQRRGVLSGGSMMVRSPVVDTTLINISLPHASGGCGGMDMFAGSVSFINADQFIALLRAIAANAKGYAFQIAMNAASSLISSKLGEFQKVIQALNSMNFNSCELAKGVVNTSLEAIGQSSIVKDYGVEANLSGFGDIADIFQHASNSKNEVKQVSEKSKADATLAKKLANLSGNIVWKALKQGNFKAGLGTGSDKDEFGALMAITGTVVIEEPQDNQSAAQEAEIPKNYKPAILLNPADFIEGGNLNVYKCKNDECTDLEPSTANVKGLKTLLLDAIKGNGATTGLIAKYRMQTTAFTDAEKKAAMALPNPAGFILQKLAIASPLTAYTKADDIATAVSMEIAFNLPRQYLHTAMYAVSNSRMQGKDEILKEMRARYNAISTELVSYAQNHPTMSQLLAEYNQTMKNVESIALTANGATPSESGSVKSSN